MEVITSKLEFVANTGGIKLDVFGDKWINPTKSAKENISKNISELKSWIGKMVDVVMEGENNFSGLSLNKDLDISKPKETLIMKSGEKIETKEDIIKISGKDFVTYEGLLKRAHEKDLKFSMKIIDSWVSDDMNKAWCIVRLISSDGQEFDGFGSSTPDNTGKMTQSHPVEMAHTRAKGRCLRDFLNIGVTMYEELKND